jgi:hypothetical protein
MVVSLQLPMDLHCGKAAFDTPTSTDATKPHARESPAMYARAVDDAATRLRELRRDERHELGLAGAALGLAIGATEFAPSLALPLLIGGLAVGVLGIRALWRHWDLVDRLADEPYAYAIAEVLAYASRETTLERRRRSAVLIRHHLESTCTSRPAGFDDARGELAALADELDDGALELSPACAVACSRLLSEPTESPLLNPALPQDGLRSSVARIRSGFTCRQVPLVIDD